MVTAKNTGGQNFDPVPAKMHHGICIWIFDLGTQRNTVYDVKQQKVIITWEIPDERITLEDTGENKPRVISKIYTNSLHEKAHLKKDLETWRGKPFTDEELKGFRLERLLGVNCNLQIMHTTRGDRTYARVATITPVSKDAYRSQEHEKKYFSFEDKTPLPDDVPTWIVDIIKKAEEWDESLGDIDPGYEEDIPLPDDIPF